MSFVNPLAQQAVTPKNNIYKTSITETERVVQIDRFSYEATDPDFWYNELHKPDAPHVNDKGEKLCFRRVQSQMFDALQDAPGGFFAVGTGHGKSYVAVLAGVVMPNVDRVIAFTTKAAMDDLNGFYFYLRQFYKVPPTFDVHSISSLSTPRPDSELDYIEEILVNSSIPPERTLLVFDEVHKLKNPSSARGGRILRFLSKFPQTRVVVLSGSMMSTSIRDCAHLAWAALRELSPYPRTFGVNDAKTNEAVLASWAACLDVKGEPTPADWQVMAPLWNWAHSGKHMSSYNTGDRRRMMREALQQRLRSCPGVVVSEDSALPGVALAIVGVDSTEITIPENVKAKLKLVRSGIAPNEEDELSDAASGWPILRQLAQGFYYVWDWPGGVKDADWILSRKRWNSDVRKEISERGDVKYDSAMLVYNKIKNDLRAELSDQEDLDWLEYIARTDQDNDVTGTGFSRGVEAFARSHQKVLGILKEQKADAIYWNWLNWSAVYKHKPEPPTKPVWVDPFFVDWAVAWAKKHADSKPILWYEHREIEAALVDRGIPCFGAGSAPDEKTAKLCGMSIAVHGTGRNFQAWNTSLILCPPASGTAWEQMLARQHRPGQKAECVTAYVCLHTEEFGEALESAYAKAMNFFHTYGSQQKFNVAEWQNIKLKQLTST